VDTSDRVMYGVACITKLEAPPTVDGREGEVEGVRPRLPERRGLTRRLVPPVRLPRPSPRVLFTCPG
jgi:hypothetical protein